MSSASSSSAAAAAPVAVSWSAAIPLPRAPTASDLSALSARFGVKIPAALAALLLAHSGEQIAPAVFWAQNVQTGAWRRDTMGPLYPAITPDPKKSEGEEANEDEDEEDDSTQYNSYNLTVVNEMFLDDIEDAEEEDDEEAAAASSQSFKAQARAKSSKNSAMSTRVKPSAKQGPKVSFFAFSESASSGLLLALDTRSGSVMLLDITGRKGPWIAGENFEDFFKVKHGSNALTPQRARGQSMRGHAERNSLSAHGLIICLLLCVCSYFFSSAALDGRRCCGR